MLHYCVYSINEHKPNASYITTKFCTVLYYNPFSCPSPYNNLIPNIPIFPTFSYRGLTELNSYIELYVYPNITYIPFILLYALYVYIFYYFYFISVKIQCFCTREIAIHDVYVRSFISMRCMSICTVQYSTVHIYVVL